MSLWGTAHAAANNKPKFLTTDEDSDYTKQDCYATQGGWSMRAGTKATGNGNTSADPEILVAIGDLAGSTDTTGLRAPTVTNMRFIWGTAATTDGSAGSSSQRILVEITWDEAVTVAGSPQIVVDNGNQSFQCLLFCLIASVLWFYEKGVDRQRANKDYSTSGSFFRRKSGYSSLCPTRAMLPK